MKSIPRAVTFSYGGQPEKRSSTSRQTSSRLVCAAVKRSRTRTRQSSISCFSWEIWNGKCSAACSLTTATAFEKLFLGTIDGTSVHAREVVKAALKCNAAAVIFAHNHPSGVAEPSRAYEALTKQLKDALALVGIRVLDHIIVAGTDTVSLAERGLL
jgi:hypothetical protein